MDEATAEVQATYYAFLSDQSQMQLNMESA